MIVTLTMNPSLDRGVTLPAPLAPGEVQSAIATREDAGGKGINVSRVIAASGGLTTAILPLAAGDPFHHVLEASAVPTHAVATAGHARANITVTDPDGVTTKLNLPGATMHVTEMQSIIDAVIQASLGASWLVLAGSLPPGVPADFYAHVCTVVRQRCGADAPKIAVDASGPALAAVVSSAKPDLIKPNENELAELVGATLAPEADLVREVLVIAAELVPHKVAAALVTLGGAGAVLITADGAWLATPPPTSVVSTVGAGDSSLAGYLLAASGGSSSADRVGNAVRYGTAAAGLPGTQAPRLSDLPTESIQVRAL